MPPKVVKSTSKGQITLPGKWRSQFDTDHYVIEFHKQGLWIKPLDLSAGPKEEVIFDAERDHSGKGIKTPRHDKKD